VTARRHFYNDCVTLVHVHGGIIPAGARDQLALIYRTVHVIGLIGDRTSGTHMHRHAITDVVTGGIEAGGSRIHDVARELAGGISTGSNDVEPKAIAVNTQLGFLAIDDEGIADIAIDAHLLNHGCLEIIRGLAWSLRVTWLRGSRSALGCSSGGGSL